MTEAEAEARSEALYEALVAIGRKGMLDHRCPECGAGLGRWCVTDGSDPRRASATVLPDRSVFYHPARANGSTDVQPVRSSASGL